MATLREKIDAIVAQLDDLGSAGLFVAEQVVIRMAETSNIADYIEVSGTLFHDTPGYKRRKVEHEKWWKEQQMFKVTFLEDDGNRV